MKRSSLCVMLALCAAAPDLRAQAPAEEWYRAGTWMFGAALGGAAFSDFQRAMATAAQPDPGLGTFERRVSARTTVTAGAAVTYWVLDGWGVRAGVSYAPSAFAVWNDGRAQRVLDELADWEREPYARLGIWFADVAALFRLPIRLGAVTPYGVLGGGVVQYRASADGEMPPEARARFAEGTSPGGALVFGAGAVVPLQQRRVLLSFELTNHVTRTPLNDAGRGEWFEIGGVDVQLGQDPRRGSDGIDLTNNVRLTVGVSLPVRR
jgi:hypothetical protein